jgi:hypothetical protein
MMVDWGNLVQMHQCFGETYSLCCQGRSDSTRNSALKNVQRATTEIEGTIVEQVSNYSYLGNLISGEVKDNNISRAGLWVG